jgi:hypothetical protein
MNLKDTIAYSFIQIITDNGTEVTNTKTNETFTALVSSGDFMADFTHGDQDTELNVQLTMLDIYAPNTGDILLIGDKRFITDTVQSRVNGILSKVTAYETKKKRS